MPQVQRRILALAHASEVNLALDRDYVLGWLRKLIEESGGINPKSGTMRAPMAVAKGIELLGKELGMFVERHELSISDLRSLDAQGLMRLLGEIDRALGRAGAIPQIAESVGPRLIDVESVSESTQSDADAADLWPSPDPDTDTIPLYDAPSAADIEQVQRANAKRDKALAAVERARLADERTAMLRSQLRKVTARASDTPDAIRARAKRAAAQAAPLADDAPAAQADSLDANKPPLQGQ